MNFPAPLISGKLIKRYKRFLSDVTLSTGEVVIAHCANPGSMIGLSDPGLEVWLSPAQNSKRKLHYTWELVRVGDSLIGINTAHPNRIVEEAIRRKHIQSIANYPELRREVRYGENSRIDLLLTGRGLPDCYVEVKNVQMCRYEKLAEFPDAVTKRGTKHLRELTKIARTGNRAIMIYVVQRTDCEKFSIAGDIDQDYAEAFHAARESGVEALVYDCHLTLQSITLDRRLEITV